MGIEHKGVVVNIAGNVVDVEVDTASDACEGCKVKSACFAAGGGDDKRGLISVFTDVPEAFSEGEQVDVVAEKGMGMKAVVLAYVVPFFVLMAVLLILLGAGAGEVVSGLSALASAAVYYVLLRLFRGKIEKEIVFKIRKINRL